VNKVVIVGRPNVGKSTLFNRLVGRRLSIVHDVPGITRDALEAIVHWKDKSFWVMDTGGLLEDKDYIAQEIRKRRPLEE
jgi:GTP-binding protein